MKRGNKKSPSKALETAKLGLTLKAREVLNIFSL